MSRFAIVFLFVILGSTSSWSQDTTVVDTSALNTKQGDVDHRPQRAALWSLIPGGGQIYNEIGYRRIPQKKHRAWWKVPIIYGGLGVCGYYFYQNYAEGRIIRQEWERRVADTTYTSSNPFNPEFLNVSTSGLESQYREVARLRDIFIAATVGIYALNLIEAFVDAHFVTFDVSDDLSLRCTPVMFDKQTPGVSLRLNLM